MGIFSKMSRTKGDFKHTWDANNLAEVANARAMFNELTQGKKFMAFRTNPHMGKDACEHCRGTGNKNTKITEFDPEACEIVFVPQMAGG